MRVLQMGAYDAILDYDWLRGCLFQLFITLWISFWEIQKLDGLKSEKLRISWKGASSFSVLEPSNFWIFQKLMKK
jgi:hypothetical protein